MRNGVQYASVTLEKMGPMYDDGVAARVIERISAFYPQGHSLVEGEVKPFDAAALVEARCGRYVRGAHKGKLRGWASIECVRIGGWKKTAPGEGNGRVVRPGQVLGLTISAFDGRPYLEVR